jgi:hypothetical protein
MGEILRAVLDKSCAFSNPAFYSIEIPAPGVGPVNRNGVLEMKSDRWFLMTGLAAYVCGTFTNGYLANSAGQFQFEILRAGRSVFNTGPVPGALFGYDCNQMLTLPEYILFGPNETLGMNLRTETATGDLPYGATLYGIEYAR